MATTLDSLKEFLREGTPLAVIERYIALEQIAADTNFGELDSNVVVVDTEATGLSYTKDELIQIAAARITNGKIEDWYVTFVNPGIEISEDIEHLTHISNEDVANAPYPSEALNGLVDFAGDAIIMAHNAIFDKTFLTKHVEGYPLLENIWVDTLDLARIAFPRLNSHRLIDLSKAFGIVESTHRADDDVASTCEIYRLILAAISQMPKDLIRVCAGIAPLSMWPSSYVFKEMLHILPNIDCQEQIEEDEYVVPKEIFDEELFDSDNSKINTFGMLRTMRNERFQELKTQIKYDVELDDEDLIATDENTLIKAANAMQFPTTDSIKFEFSKTGMLGKIYQDFEQREEQIEMAGDVLQAFRDSSNLVIEAGTGVGKSMAYLIPAIKVARENEITIGIATKTNSLLDQLIYHELPALANNFDGLVYSSLKGAKHYICLRKAAYLAASKAKLITYKGEEFCNAPSIVALISYIEQTGYDDCDGIKINGRSLPSAAYTCGSHECLRNKCPFYHNGCFVHGARRMAKNSDIVVTNHSMLFCDIKANNGILPPIRYWIIDEAHNCESEARRAFSHNILASTLLDFGKCLISESAKLNVYERSARNINTEEMDDKGLVFGLLNKCKAAGKDLARLSDLFANNICELADFTEKSKTGYEFSTIWINNDVRESDQFNNLWNIAKDWNNAAENLITETNRLLAYLEDYKSCNVISRELSAFCFDVKEILNSNDVIFFNSSDKYVYSANINLKKTVKHDCITAELYSVSDMLNEKLYCQNKSIIFTSATLATGDSFQSFKDALGLHENTRYKQLASSFDYDHNMTIYVANDMPENPNTDAFVDELAKFLAEIHIAGDGSILSLFTNRRQMEKAYDEVHENLKTYNLRLIIQKWGLSVKGVKDEFLADEKISLFALKNFWEGFDAPGSTLKGVVICKLPFARVDDPLNLERNVRESSAWSKYTLPASVIETKQAVGRLIRKAEDKGYVVFADSRLVQKPYGTVFLNSMPSNNIKVLSRDEIVKDIEKLKF